MRDWKKIRDELDDVSSSFCLAKWLQVTLDLHNGMTHSCHHPKRHKIPIDEVKKDPSALHNTQYKLRQRKSMLESKRPAECQYCWNIEDANSSNISDRMIKSSDDWAYPHLKEIANSSWDTMIVPTYLEVMFSNTCNLSCSYCMATVSSSIQQELEKYGPFPMPKPGHRKGNPEDDQNYRPLNKAEKDIYLEAFWKWFPDIYKSLHVLRITGGEPLLDKNTFKVMDYIKQNKNIDLTFAVNTNFSLPRQLTNKFFDALEEIDKKIKRSEIYLSLDSIGEKAEYIRSGLKEELFHKNLQDLQSRKVSSSIVIMCTYSVLSMDGYVDFLKYILNLKNEYKNIVLDIAYLKDPDYLSPRIAKENQLKDIRESISFMEDHYDESGKEGFDDYEIKKLRRIYHYTKVPMEKTDHLERLSNFFLFINEFDRRKGKSFDEIFPRMLDLKKKAKKCAYTDQQSPLHL